MDAQNRPIDYTDARTPDYSIAFDPECKDEVRNFVYFVRPYVRLFVGSVGGILSGYLLCSGEIMKEKQTQTKGEGRKDLELGSG